MVLIWSKWCIQNCSFLAVDVMTLGHKPHFPTTAFYYLATGQFTSDLTTVLKKCPTQPLPNCINPKDCNPSPLPFRRPSFLCLVQVTNLGISFETVVVTQKTPRCWLVSSVMVSSVVSAIPAQSTLRYQVRWGEITYVILKYGNMLYNIDIKCNWSTKG